MQVFLSLYRWVTYVLSALCITSFASPNGFCGVVLHGVLSMHGINSHQSTVWTQRASWSEECGALRFFLWGLHGWLCRAPQPYSNPLNAKALPKPEPEFWSAPYRAEDLSLRRLLRWTLARVKALWRSTIAGRVYFVVVAAAAHAVLPLLLWWL